MLRIREYIYFPAEDGKTMNRRKVDLKELEKFGFREMGSIFYKPKKGEATVIEIKVNKSNRTIDITGLGDLFNTKEDTLYDLITAGLVEKVEEER